jgi:enoyl-CoA hydratase/carnithine racemase
LVLNPFMQELIVERFDKSRLVRLKLNIPEKCNALSLNLLNLLKATLIKLKDDPEVKLIFIEGVGEKGFCSGGDIVQVCKWAKLSNELGNKSIQRFFQVEYSLDYLLYNYPKPIIAWGNGIVMGGGAGLWKGCTFSIATEKTVFRMPECRIGFFPDVGSGWFLGRLPRRIGLFIALTTAELSGSNLLALGLADFLIESTKIETIINQLLDLKDSDQILSNLIKIFKDLQKQSNNIYNPEIIKKMDLIYELMLDVNIKEWVNNIHLANTTTDTWISDWLKVVPTLNPLSLAVTWEYYSRTKYLSLKEILNLDYKLATKIATMPDFIAGVTAHLIEKDNKPNWSYPNVEEVPIELVSELFN